LVPAGLRPLAPVNLGVRLHTRKLMSTTKILRKGRCDTGTIVRWFSPVGLYPTQSVGDKHAAYIYGSDISFSIVNVSPIREMDNYYSEVEWAHPEEICLYAALALSRNSGECPIILYPSSEYWSLSQGEASNALDQKSVEQIKLALISETEKRGGLLANSFQYLAPPAPPKHSQLSYEDCRNGFNPERFERLLAGIDPQDYLLIRGLSTWLRAAMLSVHLQFLEEAITSIFISLEASYRIVLRKLKESGNPNPSSKDAANFISKVFNEPPIEKYFAEFYDNRIMTFHPESRFGTFPHAPVMADDYFHLRDSLRELYVYLITGEILSANEE